MFTIWGRWSATIIYVILNIWVLHVLKRRRISSFYYKNRKKTILFIYGACFKHSSKRWLSVFCTILIRCFLPNKSLLYFCRPNQTFNQPTFSSRLDEAFTKFYTFISMLLYICHSYQEPFLAFSFLSFTYLSPTELIFFFTFVIIQSSLLAQHLRTYIFKESTDLLL